MSQDPSQDLWSCADAQESAHAKDECLRILAVRMLTHSPRVEILWNEFAPRARGSFPGLLTQTFPVRATGILHEFRKLLDFFRSPKRSRRLHVLESLQADLPSVVREPVEDFGTESCISFSKMKGGEQKGFGVDDKRNGFLTSAPGHSQEDPLIPQEIDHHLLQIRELISRGGHGSRVE